MTTYYENLGVAEGSEDVVISAAYRALMKKYHPDVFKGDPAHARALAQRINEAHSILGDAGRRAAYDLTLRTERQKGSSERGANASPPPPPPPPRHQSDQGGKPAASYSPSEPQVWGWGRRLMLAFFAFLVAVSATVWLAPMPGPSVAAVSNHVPESNSTVAGDELRWGHAEGVTHSLMYGRPGEVHADLYFTCNPSSAEVTFFPEITDPRERITVRSGNAEDVLPARAEPSLLYEGYDLEVVLPIKSQLVAEIRRGASLVVESTTYPAPNERERQEINKFFAACQGI